MPEEDFNPFANHQLDPYNHVNQLLREDSDRERINAANFLRDVLGHEGNIASAKSALAYINTVWHSFLDADMYAEAATLNWGYGLFDARPQVVSDLFNFLQTQNLMCILGASSSSKSYGCVAWLYLDYQRDPDYTSIKMATISGTKLRGLLFSPMDDLHKASVMEVVGKTEPNYRFTHNVDNINVGFEGILVPQDQKGTGKLKGVKYYRRPKPHQIFGKTTRTRIFVDEFQDTSAGIIKDLSSPESQIHGPHSMKIALSGNPTDYSLSGAFGILSEPEKGWADFDIENMHRWKSKRGYNVLRLDGARCENVIYKKNVCSGLISHEGFEKLAADTDSAEYFTFARGIFPLAGGANTLFSVPMIESHTADALFHEGSINIGFVDVALRNDYAMFGYGKIGMATGRIDPDGTKTMFTTGTTDKRDARLVLQVDGLERLEGFGGDTIKLSKIVRTRAGELGIQANYLGVDKNGMGEGVVSYLANYFGNVLGVNSGDGATDRKILLEDKQLPEELYSRISDELWFAGQKWMAAGALLITPKLSDREALVHQLTTRNIGAKSSNGRQKMEEKEKWRIRNSGKSCDEADCVLGMVHVARFRTNFIPAMEQGATSIQNAEPFKPPNADYVESLHFNSLTRDKNRPKPFDVSQLRRTHIVGQG